MNSISIAGILGRDCETKYLNNGDPVTNFSVADSQGVNKPTIWWNCSLFGKRAGSLAPYLLKGQNVTVSGTVTEREYTDKQGNKQTAREVRVSDVALQGRPNGNSSSNEQSKNSATKKINSDDMNDDIPF